MAKRGTRKAGHGFASRVFRPVGAAVNRGATVVRNVFHGVKKVGSTVVKGTNKVINSIGNSFSKNGKRRGKRATRRRKN